LITASGVTDTVMVARWCADGSGVGVDGNGELDRVLRVTLESVVPGVRLTGVAGAGPVQVVSTKWFGSSIIQVTYTTPDGRNGQTLLRRDDEPRLRLEHAGRTRPMDGDADEWRLGAEALRIRYAALFDPMLAIATSDLRPLPHQIKAVYGEMLPRVPMRFLLADDPGAGKTIMCGLYIKELMLRGDLARCLIVAPGSLVEQWQDELHEKFGLQFEVLNRPMIEATGLGQNVFDRHPLLIARMDQLSRSDDLKDALGRTDWDLVVVDEAHRMSAHWFGQEVSITKRYDLGRLLGRVTRHLLLMTATPHAGKQDDFQLFLALLDGDRFEGKYRDGVHAVRADDLMRRMVKEELLTMDGKPLFPERRATTVPYRLSDQEQELYEVVTDYVREEMGRADNLDEGEGRRRTNVGFALTVLQRRLASSPEAILRSLERRRARLQKRLRESSAERLDDDLPVKDRLARILGRDERVDEALDDLAGDELEELEDTVVDAATAARTRAELQAEISVLDDLVEVAHRVRTSDTDRKWSELRSILVDHALQTDAHGQHRKLIVFTEHRDTLEYLRDRITSLLGDERSVVTIHGGVRREDRRKAQELFTQDKDTRILVATDAAGEGLNLQRAHLMVNYDLPWNPNKIEQRFGRIHRIGQTEVCHLWNLVAAGTREGEVYLRLLEKVEEQRAAYGGKVFDVLGDAFEDQPLRDLMVRAIRYGDEPTTRAYLNTVIDASIGEGISKLLTERALHHQSLPESDVDEIRRRMEDAQARRLQPHFIQAFFLAAFRRLGGSIKPRERGRFEVTNVPISIRDYDRQAGTGATVLTRYERVCFERDNMHTTGLAPAQLVAPGHPLLDAVVEMTISQCASTLRQGAVLVDPNDPSTTPRLLVAIAEQISNGHGRTVSKRFSFVELDDAGRLRAGGSAPYLDYRGASPEEADSASSVFDQEWLRAGAEEIAAAWAVEHLLGEHRAEVYERVSYQVARTRTEVRSRLIGQIKFWDSEHVRLLDLQGAGRQLRMSPETAERRARELEHRLVTRMAALEADAQLAEHPPVVAGAALVVPQGLLDQLNGASPIEVAMFAKSTQEVDQRAVAAVLAAERSLGAQPEEMPHNNPGFDVRSVRANGRAVRIEVKGRIEGADTFTITKNEVVTAKNLGDDYRLALVRVSRDGAAKDDVRYVERPFDETDTSDFRTLSYNQSWARTWSQGTDPR
jgi:SNF2 family DNA or RNA helicase